MTDDETRALLAEVFAPDLNGHSLLSNNSKWLNFVNVKNTRWATVVSPYSVTRCTPRHFDWLRNQALPWKMRSR